MIEIEVQVVAPQNLSNNLIDTKPSFPQVLKSAAQAQAQAQVSDIIITGTSLSGSCVVIDIATKFNVGQHFIKLHSTVEVNPYETTRHSSLKYRQQFIQMLKSNPSVMALGECELGFHRNFSLPDHQRTVFDT